MGCSVITAANLLMSQQLYEVPNGVNSRGAPTPVYRATETLTFPKQKKQKQHQVSNELRNAAAKNRLRFDNATARSFVSAFFGRGRGTVYI